MLMPTAPLIRSHQEASTVAVVGHCYTIVVTGQATGESYSMIDAHIPVGDVGTPLHTHHREDETFYILDGEVTFLLDGRYVVAGPGTMVHGPRDLPHAFRNKGERPARMIVIATPAGLEDFFAEVGEPLPSGATEAPLPTAEHASKIIAAAPRYGVELHGMPPAV